MARFQNTEMCRLTEQVIFTDPYYAAPPNRHTSPQLDALAAAFREDAEAKAQATRLKASLLRESPGKYPTAGRGAGRLPAAWWVAWRGRAAF